ncbi:ABC transporter substrate-binding protein [Nonomuraea sp. NPDC050643]|uniref:ABC transporter substrate-binding protein n=1 Tax=Nonomuraea sp. NPDC050643 TaxID=3155660 RepID=UPI0033E01309
MRPLRSGDPSSIGSYELTGFLGEGGQGSVYLGLTPSGERVAVKLLHARFTEDERAVRRFLREADAARRVAEFCTARVLDVAQADGQPYIVGEYVEGPSLQRHVTTEGPMRGQALVRLAVSTATALAAIHRAGVIHRDFKPGNVLLGPDGPRVIDFGIARALDVSQSMTSSVVGTPAFMAPEQFLGDAEPASDVFAWAGTMVFAATGRGAFGFGALPMVMHRILNSEPDLAGVPEELVPLLRAALSKDHRQRPAADRLLRDLIRPSGPQPAAPGQGYAPPPPPPPGSAGAAAPGGPWAGGAPGPFAMPALHDPAPPGAPRPSMPGPAPAGAGQPPYFTPPARGTLGTSPAPGGRSGKGLLVTLSAAATAVVVGVAAWGVVQLGRQGTPTTSTSGSPTAGPAAAGYGGALTSVVRPSGKKGGTVRLASAVGLDSTDPGDMFMAQSWNLARLYGRSLTMFKPVPGAAGAQVVPDLAEALGQPSDGGRTWTYRLRQGVKYQDGTPITSADVKHAVLRSMDSGLIQGSLFFDNLLDLPSGYEGPYKSPEAGTGSAIETPDDRTIVFHLREPFATFDHVAQLPETIPVPKASDKRDKYRFSVISSGPYQVDSADEQGAGEVVVRLSRNPHWDPATDRNRTALPDRFELSYGMETAEAATAIKAGAAEVGSVLPDAEIAGILGDPARKAQADAPITTIRTLSINPQVAPFDKIDCRRAVVRALDLESVQAADRALPDQVPTSLVPPTVTGEHYADPDLRPRGDQAAARESLAKCGRPDGFSAVYLHRDLPGETKAAQAVKAGLAKVGIEITLQQAPITDFYRSKGGSPEYLKKQKIGLVARSWISDWPDPWSYLPLQVDSRQISEKGSSINVSVRLPAVDELLDRAAKELDAQVRAGLWAEVERRVADEAVLVPLTWRRSLLLRGAKAADLHVSPVYGDYDLVTMSVTASS